MSGCWVVVAVIRPRCWPVDVVTAEQWGRRAVARSDGDVALRIGVDDHRCGLDRRVREFRRVDPTAGSQSISAGFERNRACGAGSGCCREHHAVPITDRLSGVGVDHRATTDNVAHWPAGLDRTIVDADHTGDGLTRDVGDDVTQGHVARCTGVETDVGVTVWGAHDELHRSAS